MGLALSLLGVPRVLRDGQAATFETRKAMALLAHLALAERPRPRQALCALLWPDVDLDRGRGALRRTLSTLRSGIGKEWVEVVGDSVSLRRTSDLELDVARFRALAADAESEEPLTQAVALFSGEFMEGFSLRDSPDFDDWQAGERRGLERELASVLRLLVGALAARGDYEHAIPHARNWLELDPLHEPAHRELIRLYAWSGERAAALEQYRKCVRTLSDELGVAPLAETAALYEEVNDGTLAQRVEAPPAAEPQVRAERAAAPVELSLVGREQDLALLLEAHAQARVDGCLAVIEGEAGIGKTRLAAELRRSVQDNGGVVLAARCHEDEGGLPYGAVVELLREAARHAASAGWPAAVPTTRLADASLLLPDLAELNDVPANPLPLVGDGAHVRLLEGVAAVLTAACKARPPGVVFIDDVHAADEATMDAISYLAHRLDGRELLLMIAWRSEAVPPGHRLRRLVADLARDGRATIVTPRRLSERDVARLIPAGQSDEAAEPLARRVYLESEGLPLFVAEYLTAVQTDGDVAGLPAEVRNLLDARVRGLSDVGRQVLGAAAVIGRLFDLETLREASGR